MKYSRLVSASVLALLFSGCQGVGSTQMTGKPVADIHTEHNTMNSSNQPVAGEYLLTLKPGVPEDAQTLADLRRDLGSLPVVALSSLGHRLYLVKIHPDPGLKAIEGTLSNSSLVTSIQENRHYGINPPDRRVLY
ncbi:MAG: hypothetical protein IE913_11650 [Halothiobacillus sp.]|nr:hypothetical protein [Halothiobacillus sp.]